MEEHSKLFHYCSRIGFNLLRTILLGRRKVYGLENLPKDGPYMLITNHCSVADSLLILLSTPALPINFLIGEKWERVPLVNVISKNLGGIFVDRVNIDRQSIRKAINILEEGGILGLAPEGMRSPVGKLIKPRHGGAYIVSRANVPVIPIGLHNTGQFFKNARSLRITNLEVHVGKPFMLPELEGRIRGKELEAYSDYMMLKIAELLPKTYHGYYAFTQHKGWLALQNGGDIWQGCLEEVGLDAKIPMSVEHLS